MGIPVEVVAPTPPGVVVDVVFISLFALAALAPVCVVWCSGFGCEEQARDSSLTV